MALRQAIAAIVSGAHTQLRIANTNFGTGSLLMTIRNVNNFSEADVTDNLSGATFNFS